MVVEDEIVVVPPVVGTKVVGPLTCVPEFVVGTPVTEPVDGKSVDDCVGP
jgi:hypothetical protein